MEPHAAILEQFIIKKQFTYLVGVAATI